MFVYVLAQRNRMVVRPVKEAVMYGVSSVRRYFLEETGTKYVCQFRVVVLYRVNGYFA
jgi:hypothetical protein